MENSSKRIFTVLILFVNVLIFSMLSVTAGVASVPQAYTIADESIEIDEKYKKVSTNKIKIIFNANGGKIGAKTKVTTDLRKGAKIKLPTTPKRPGYRFKGWYTKKTGGTKISVNIKPAKSLTYFAQWKKGSSRILNAEEKKLVGTWRSYYFGDAYYFTDKGTVIYNGDRSVETATGNYKVSGGKITFTNLVSYYGGNKRDYPKTQVAEYKLEKKSQNEYLTIRSLTRPDMTYLDLKSTTTYSKMG